ncbi:histidine kinase [Pullulanibacillus pueri]|nr:histidine kinase [Pullulanibacillus pueri]
MSIRKRLFFSNALMVVTPIVMFVLYFILLHLFFDNDLRYLSNSFHGEPKTAQQKGKEQRVFTQLQKVASLNAEQLLNVSYLDKIASSLNGEQAGLIIRHGNTIIYTSDDVEKVSQHTLPEFGNEGYTPVTWLGHEQYEISQHDFFFKDGSEGSIFVIKKGEAFYKFARKFFPLIIFGVIGIVVTTNIVLSYIVSRGILKPVHQLSWAADQVKQGNLDFHMESTKKDELAKLVNTFENMRAKLKEGIELRDRYERNRKELIANISHDLKTPMTSIRGYVEGIKDGVADTKGKLEQYLETIQTKSEYMDRLIDELFLYSKLDLNRLPFHFEKVDLLGFMKDYVEEIRLELVGKNVQLSLVSEPVHVKVPLDRDKLIRVLNNIIYNSVKYNDKEESLIQLAITEEKQRVKVTLSDNGPGVSQEALAHIFTRFYRSDPARQADTGGSGLGLAIAEQIIKAHGGAIWAENNPGGGLRISFTLQKSETKGEENEKDINH